MISYNFFKGRALRIVVGITVLVLLLATSIYSAQGAMYPEAKLIVLSKESNVSVTFEGSGGPGDITSYNNLFGLWSPRYNELFWGKSTSLGTKFDLGYFPSYTELIFFIKSPDGTFLSGPAARNPDNTVHAAITDVDFQTWRVGFEDMRNGGDRDYNDITVLVKGDFYVIPPNPQKPDFIVLPGDITFSNNNPKEGDIVEIQANVRNFGSSLSSDIILGFYDGDPDTGGALISTATINGIGKEENVIETITWDTTGKAGTHKVYIKIDTENLIDETLESNNIASQDINIGNTPASIKIISPDALSNWQIGSSQTIEWTYTGNPGSNVKIELLKGFVIEPIQTIELQAPIGEYGSGTYLWSINPPTGIDYLPGIPYRIRITNSDGSASDTSEYFTFNNQPISLPGIITEVRTWPLEPLYTQDYRIYLHLYNPNSVAEHYRLELKNDESTICSLENPQPSNVKNSPYSTHVYSFHCKTDWKWIPEGESGWMGLGKVLTEEGGAEILDYNVGLVSDAVTGTTLNLVPIAESSVSVLSTLKLSYEVKPAKPYFVDLDSMSSSGITFDFSVNRNVIVQVPSSKKVLLLSSAVYDMGSSGLSMTGVLLGLTTGGTTAVVAVIAEAANAITAWTFYQQAYDPDFNYTTVQALTPMYLPELDLIPDGDAKKFALATAEITSLRNATFTAYVRADGARIDNQSDYRLMQLDAANNFTLQAMQKMPEVKKYYKLMTASMEPLTDEQIQQIRTEIQANGLPQAEIDIFTRNGLGDDIGNFTQMVLKMSPEVYRNPKNYTNLLNFQTGVFAYESTEYTAEIIRLRIQNKGMNSTNASESDITYLEDLKTQINQRINQGTATPNIRTLIDEMIDKSREVLDETNNLAYMPYYEFALNALAVFPALDITSPEITSFTPTSPVNDIVGVTRTFTVNMNQTTNVTWYVNETEIFNQSSVTQSSYTNTSAALGTWNVIAIAVNENGTGRQTWVWTVTPVPIAGGSISGYKINDTNGNGKWDANEAGIQGWNITLKNVTTGSVIVSKLTDANGFYQFMNLVNGSYNVTEEMRIGFTPTNATFNLVNITGLNVMNMNFTNQPMIKPVGGLMNPGFENGTSNWIFFTNGTGNFTTSPPGYEGNNAANIVIYTGGTNVQLYQKGISLEPDTRYRLRFAAKSTTGHDLSVSVFKHGSPFTSYGLGQRFDLNNNWQEFSTECITTGFTGMVNDARLMFYLAPFATAGDRYYIDDVRLEKVIQTGTLNVTTIPASGNIYVDSVKKGTGSWSELLSVGSHAVSFGPVSGYLTPPSQTVEVLKDQTTPLIITYAALPNLILNPGFESGTSPWIFFTNGTGKFTASPPGYEGNNTGNIVIYAGGTNVQLYQKEIPLEPHTSYRLRFSANSTTGHDLSVSVFKHGSPYSSYGLDQRFDLKKDWQEFSTEFTTTGFTGTVNDARLMFYIAPFGEAGDKYYIDDVRLEKI